MSGAPRFIVVFVTSLWLLAGAGIHYASAASVLFEFGATATFAESDIRSAINPPNLSPVVDNVRAGDLFAGAFTITDEPIEDKNPSPSRDEYEIIVTGSTSSEVFELVRDHQFESLEFRTDDYLAFSDDSLSVRQISTELTLINGDTEDEIRIRHSAVKRSQANLIPIRMSILLRDPTGTALSAGDLTGNYQDAVNLLRNLDLSKFSASSGGLYRKINRGVGGSQAFTLNFNLTTLSERRPTELAGLELISTRTTDSAAANGTSWDPSLSADASLLAFSSDATDLSVTDSNGNIRDVFVHNRASGEIRNLTNGGNGTSNDPVLSKDGKWLAFRTEATNLPTDVPDTNGQLGDIVIANVATGELTLVTAGANGASSTPSLSRNGRRLVFETLASNLASVNNHHPRGCSPTAADPDRRCVSSIVLYDRVSRFLLELSQGGTTASRAPTIDESGTSVAFVSSAFSFGRRSMVIMDLEGGSRRGIGAPELALDASRPVISPDGRWLAVMNLPVDQGVSQPPQLLLYDRSGFAEPYLLGNYRTLPGEFSSDSRYLMYSANALGAPSTPGDFESAIYRVDLTNAPTFTEERVTPAGDQSSGGPTTNQDGSIVAWDSASANFVSEDNNNAYDVFLRDLNQPEENRPPVASPLTLTVSANQSVPIVLTGFDPDGDTLSFVVTEEPANGRLDGVPPALTYTPAPGYSGSDSFTFVVQDAEFSSEPAEVAITIEPEASADHTLTAVQREGSRTIDLRATWPANSVWTQVREYDGPTSVLWDGQATIWTGSYTPAAGISSVTFNSRYWLPGITTPNDSIDVTLTLEAPVEPDGFTVDGFAWLDEDGDSRRDDEETADDGRAITLYRCEAPWGALGTVLSSGTSGTFDFRGVSAGKYQIGTNANGVEFSPVANDNIVTANGFSNCFDVDGSHPQVGVGILVASSDRISLTGFSWLDASNDGARDTSEQADVGRTVTAYRCEAPWGLVGSAETDDTGSFAIPGVVAGKYQFGIAIAGITLSPKANDNNLYANGFSDCIDFTVGDPSIGIGVVR